jgi:hypothetical protein
MNSLSTIELSCRLFFRLPIPPPLSSPKMTRFQTKELSPVFPNARPSAIVFAQNDQVLDHRALACFSECPSLRHCLRVPFSLILINKQGQANKQRPQLPHIIVADPTCVNSTGEATVRQTMLKNNITN